MGQQKVRRFSLAAAESKYLVPLIRRTGNPLEWSAAARAALACSTVFSLAFVWALYFNWLVADPARAPYLDPRAAEIGRHLQNLFVLGWLVLFGICMLARTERFRSLGEPLVYLTAQLFTVHTMLVAHGFGLFTAPYGVLFGIVGMLMGSLMFGARPVVFGAITGIAIQVFSTAGSQLGWFRYAPLLRGELVENGRLPVSWLILTGSWTTLCQMASMLIAIYLLSQWQNREDRLREAYLLLREQKSQLVRAESLAAVGSLVAGAAGELHAPLNDSASAFQRLRNDIAGSEAAASQKAEALQLVEFCLKGHGRATDIVGRLYSLTGTLTPAGDLGPLVTVLDSVRAAYPSVNIDAGPETASVSVNTESLTTVLRNLLDNALAAGGAQPPVLAARLAGQNLKLSVTDSGSGIPASIQGEVFRPFFTGQKAGEGHGVGLGLYIVHELVQRMGGTVSLHSEEGRGTAVTAEIHVGRTDNGARS